MPRIRNLLTAAMMIVALTPAVGALTAKADPNCGVSFNGECLAPPYQQMEQAATTAGLYSALPLFPLNTGTGGADQFSGATTAMLTQYEQKVNRLQETIASDPQASANILLGFVEGTINGTDAATRTTTASQ